MVQINHSASLPMKKSNSNEEFERRRIMSFTAAQQVFGSIQESALTDMIRAFLTAWHGYLRYGSAAFVSATTVNAKHPHMISTGSPTAFSICSKLP